MVLFYLVMKKKKRLAIHKMDDWMQYRVRCYKTIINRAQDGFQDRMVAQRVQANKWGVYQTPKIYENGYAKNDGSWLVFNTSRVCKDKDTTVYKDKVFCKDRNQVIDDLYGYILFLRKVGVDVVFEMNYYAVAFLSKYIRFYDKVFDCTAENQKKIGELCRSAFDKAPEDIDCSTRIDPRRFVLDPYEIEHITKGMTKRDATAMTTKFQKEVQKRITDEMIEKLYDPDLSVRKNVSALKNSGVDVSVGRLYQWIKENTKE